MTEEAAILNRIREALRATGNAPGRDDSVAPGRDHASSVSPSLSASSSPLSPGEDRVRASSSIRSALPFVGDSADDRIALFAQHSEALRTTFIRVPDGASARERVRDIARSERWRRVAAHRSPLVDDVVASLGLPTTITDGGYDRSDLASCDAAVTACDALIAQTGSVLVTSRTTGGRALSVIAEHHVVIASVDQLLPNLPSAYALLRERYASGGDWPSMISMITGPSRTGDIERILVLGAHGPKRLTVVLTGCARGE